MSTISLQSASTANDEMLVRQLVQQCYFNGAFNALDTVSMRAGFHPDFAIFGIDGEALDRYPVGSWIDAIGQRKATPAFAPASAARDCRILSLDVTQTAAALKVEIHQAGKLQYTDYLSLLKFDSGWKIVGKVYVEHG